uniref:Glycopeptidase n=1 Tax=Acidianus brierleyi TaxID=41673 RepID=A0A2U9IDS4_9CREN
MKRFAILILLILTIVQFSIFFGYTQGTEVSPSSFVHPLISNITVSSKISFTEDPSYYSFEAYHIIPPNVTPLVIHVATNLLFNDTGLRPFYIKTYIPPGNYSMELLNVSIKEFNGTQYDRQAYIFVNGVPIFWGSTQEINNSTAEADVTMFENLLKGNVTFEPVIQNYYDAKVGITGLYELNITLYLYPGTPPKGLPNEFIPLFVNVTVPFNYSYVILNPKFDSITSSIKIPNGTYKMDALIYEEGGGNDEFWYTNEPATRSIMVYYDSHLASIVNPYETIYTGGIDLFYWKPLTSIDTLSFHNPYIIDLTPMIAYGTTANVTVSVSNLLQAYQLTGSLAYDWDIAGVMMLWVNQSNPLVGAKIITEFQNYMDSSPLFFGGYQNSEYYQEGGHYYLAYKSELMFEHGIENTSVIQYGRFYAYQTFNSIYELANLTETFSEIAKETGFYNSTLIIQGDYPISMYIDAAAVPITNPKVIPFNLSYEQEGYIDLGLHYYYSYTFDNYNKTTITNEKLYSNGGFGGIIEIINSYGGAVLVALTSNTANTVKDLSLTYLVNGKGFNEEFSAEGIQNSTVNLNGYYIYIHETFTNINPTNSLVMLNSVFIATLDLHRSARL